MDLLYFPSKNLPVIMLCVYVNGHLRSLVAVALFFAAIASCLGFACSFTMVV